MTTPQYVHPSRFVQGMLLVAGPVVRGARRTSAKLPNGKAVYTVHGHPVSLLGSCAVPFEYYIPYMIPTVQDDYARYVDLLGEMEKVILQVVETGDWDREYFRRLSRDIEILADTYPEIR